MGVTTRFPGPDTSIPDRFLPGLLVAVLLHGLAALLLPFSEAPHSLPPPAISVEFVSPAPTDSEVPKRPSGLSPRPQPLALSPTDALQSDEPVAIRRIAPVSPSYGQRTDGLTQASRLYAATALSGPASSDLRRQLRQSTGPEQMIQICDLEAMEQVAEAGRGGRPDKVMAYARAALILSATQVTAEGAAVRLDGQWRQLRYRCTVDTRAMSVSAFAFAVGGTIPRERWEELALPYD